MSGAFSMPHQLTGGAGYKANNTYDEFLRKHSDFYRRHSAAGNALEDDRRRSSAAADAGAAQQAVDNVNAEERRGSFAAATGGAATANSRKGSVVVASDSSRKDSIVGMESHVGIQMDPNRRPSTSLASDLLHKIKGDKQ